MVPAPSFLTFASQDVRILNSRSVAVMVSWLPFASTSKFDRIGMVVLRSTTPCVVLSSFNSAVLDTLNSIDWLSSRAVPVADIRSPFWTTLICCCVLYSFLRLGERLTNCKNMWKLVESRSRPAGDNKKDTAVKSTTGSRFFVAKKASGYCCCDERCEFVETAAKATKLSALALDRVVNGL